MGGFRIPFAAPPLYRGESRIPELIMRGGEAAAAGHLRGGDIWGGAVQGIGQQTAGAIQQVSQAREMAKRDAAFVAAVESWDGKDPRALLTGLTRILGPRDGPQAAQGVLAFHALGQKDVNADLKNLPTLLRVAEKLPDPVMERWYPAMREKAAGALQALGVPADQLPEAWSPELRPQLGALLQALEPPKEEAGFTLSPGQQRFGPGGQPIAAVPPEPPKPPAKHKVVVPGPRGEPIARLATEEELTAGVPEYRAPTQPAQPTQRFTPKMVVVEGKEVQANYDALTGKYHHPDTGEVLKGVGVPPTADMRNKAQARTLVAKSINAIEDLSKRILTKVGPAQRAQAIKRGAEAVFGSDPEFRTYQDARMGLAGNLAVAQQGSRPSDADIRAIWLPLVPDAYRDTAESSRMKWDLIKIMSSVEGGAGGTTNIGRFKVEIE